MGPQLSRSRIFLFTVFLCTVCTLAGAIEKVKVYSFGATRQRYNHLAENSEKYLDWDDLHCVRLDHEPIVIPDEFTWCTWYMMDMLPPEGGTAINIYSLTSSTTGKLETVCLKIL